MEKPAERAENGGQTTRRASIAWFCVAIATFAQVYSPQAILPAITEGFQISPSDSAWAVGITSLGVAVSVLPFAKLGDRICPTTLAKWTSGAAVVLGFLCVFAPNFPIFLALRLACGLALGGVPALAIPALARTLGPASLGGAVALFVSGNALGGLLGRVVTGPVADVWNWQAAIGAISLISAATTTLFIIVVPAAQRPATPAQPLLSAVSQSFRNPGVATLLAQGFLLMGGFTVIYNFVGFHLEAAPFALSSTQVSWLFYSYVLAAIAPPLIWKVAERTTPTAAFLACTSLVVLSLPLMLTSSLTAVAIGVVIFTAAFFCAHGLASGLIGIRSAGSPGASIAPALYNLSFYIATGVFGWLGGSVYAAGGWKLSVAVCAVTTLGAMALAWRYASNNPAPPHA